MPRTPPLTVMLVALLLEPKVLAAFVNKTVPVVPLLMVGVPVPEIRPDKVSVLPDGALMVAAPLMAMGLLSVTVAAPACSVVPAAKANDPAPTALLLATTNVPPETDVSPL